MAASAFSATGDGVCAVTGDFSLPGVARFSLNNSYDLAIDASGQAFLTLGGVAPTWPLSNDVMRQLWLDLAQFFG